MRTIVKSDEKRMKMKRRKKKKNKICPLGKFQFEKRAIYLEMASYTRSVCLLMFECVVIWAKKCVKQRQTVHSVHTPHIRAHTLRVQAHKIKPRVDARRPRQYECMCFHLYMCVYIFHIRFPLQYSLHRILADRLSVRFSLFPNERSAIRFSVK